MSELHIAYNGAIRDEFIEKYQHQRIKKAPYLMPNHNFFGANKLQLQCTIYLGIDYKDKQFV